MTRYVVVKDGTIITDWEDVAPPPVPEGAELRRVAPQHRDVHLLMHPVADLDALEPKQEEPAVAEPVKADERPAEPEPAAKHHGHGHGHKAKRGS